MNKTITTALLLLALSGSNSIAQTPSIDFEWKPPLLPIALTYNTNTGFGIKGTASSITPLGEFSVSSPTYNISQSNSEKDKNKIINERVVVEKPVYKNRMVYKTEVKYVDKIVEVPVIKEVVKEVIVKEKEYLLVIRNTYTKKDMLFIIQGIAEFSAEVDGHTLFTAKESQIIIDITGAESYKIKFRGNYINNRDSDLIDNEIYANYNYEKPTSDNSYQWQSTQQKDYYEESKKPSREFNSQYNNGYGELTVFIPSGKWIAKRWHFLTLCDEST